MPNASMIKTALTFVAVLVAYKIVAPKIGLPTI